MSNVTILSAKGFSQEEAFANKAKFSLAYDATIAFRNAGEPSGEDLKKFATEYLAKKTKSLPGAGVVIKIVSGKEDSRERPYKADIVVTEGTRKFNMVYQLIDADNKIVGQAETKNEALSLAKEVVTATRKDVKVVPIKVVVEGTPLAATVSYTPSVGTQEGEYIFFGIETV